MSNFPNMIDMIRIDNFLEEFHVDLDEDERGKALKIFIERYTEVGASDEFIINQAKRFRISAMELKELMIAYAITRMHPPKKGSAPRFVRPPMAR